MAVKKRKNYDEHELLIHKVRVFKANNWTVEEIASELKVPFWKVRDLLQEASWRDGTFTLI